MIAARGKERVELDLLAELPLCAGQVEEEGLEIEAALPRTVAVAAQPCTRSARPCAAGASRAETQETRSLKSQMGAPPVNMEMAPSWQLYPLNQTLQSSKMS